MEIGEALIAGKRSGSGKLVHEHYDKLIQIWGDCPNTEPLPAEVDTQMFNEEAVSAQTFLHSTVNESISDGFSSDTSSRNKDVDEVSCENDNDSRSK